MKTVANTQRRKKVHLYGKLKELCGDRDYVYVSANNAKMIARGLAAIFGNKVKAYIRDNNWEFFVGDVKDNRTLSEQEVEWKLQDDTVHLMPVVEGSSGRTGQIIVGVILIVVGIIMIWGSWGTNQGGWQAAAQGFALIFSGANMVITAGNRSSNDRESPDERKSFVFNQATNTVEQGGPVPLVYGRFRTGSVVVSAGIETEEVEILHTGGGAGGGSTYPDNPGEEVVE